MTLRTRIAVAAAFAVAVAVVFVSIGAYLAARSELRSEIDASLIQRARVIEAVSEDLPAFLAGPGRRRPLPGLRGSDFDVLYYQFITIDGTVLAPADQHALPVVATTDLADGPELADAEIDGVHVRMVSVDAGRLGIVQLARPLTEVDATLSGLAVILFSVGAFGTVIAALIGLLIARSALRPIHRLTEAAENVAETQELDARIDVGTEDEVGRLAASFNAMLGALEESRDQQRRLVRDAGHELRTPLTALRTNLELLERGEELDSVQRTELIEAATLEVSELTELVTEVVDLASDRFAEEQEQTVRLDEIVARSVGRLRRRTERSVEFDAAASVVTGRPSSLERAVDNLLDNAHKWSPHDEVIEVTVGDGRVGVSDHGPGIGVGERARVFDRFYRTPEARTMPGSGLGLSIVSQVVDDHGGEVFVTETPGGGATVGFRIPFATD